MMIVPYGWSNGSLGTVIRSIDAGYSAPNENRLTVGDEQGVLQTSSVVSGVFDPRKHKVVLADHEKLRVPVKANTIILGRKNSDDVVGASAFAAKDYPNLFLSDLLWELQATSDTNPLWLSYILQLGSTRERLRLSATGTQSSMKNLNRNVFLKIPIAVPPLPEQRKIAEILRTWDDAIELAEAHIAGLQMRRHWLRMEVLTGRVRMGDHARPWSTTALRGVLREHKQRSSGSEEVFSVSVHKGLVNQKKHLGRSFAAANTGHYNLVNPGDIVYTKSPTGDFPLGIIKRSSAPDAVIVSPLYAVFTPQNPDLGVILDAYFESPRTVQNYLSPLVQKGAKNTISITNQGFLGGHLTLPVDPEEQSDLAKLLTVSRDEIAAAQRKAKLLRVQKRGLMQKLLTGQVRVNVAAESEPGGQEDD